MKEFCSSNQNIIINLNYNTGKQIRHIHKTINQFQWSKFDVMPIFNVGDDFKIICKDNQT